MERDFSSLSDCEEEDLDYSIGVDEEIDYEGEKNDEKAPNHQELIMISADISICDSQSEESSEEAKEKELPPYEESKEEIERHSIIDSFVFNLMSLSIDANT